MVKKGKKLSLTIYTAGLSYIIYAK